MVTGFSLCEVDFFVSLSLEKKKHFHHSFGENPSFESKKVFFSHRVYVLCHCDGSFLPLGTFGGHSNLVH